VISLRRSVHDRNYIWKLCESRKRGIIGRRVCPDVGVNLRQV
jgi:hypothetical protein